MNRRFIPVSILLLAGLLGWVGFIAAEETEKPVKEDVSEERITELIKQLGDNDFEVREVATEELITIGEPCLRFLRQTLADEFEGPDIRMRVKWIIAKIETLLRPKNLPEIWGKEVWYGVKARGIDFGYVCCQTSRDEYKNMKVLKFNDYFYERQKDRFVVSEMVILCRQDSNLSLLYSKVKENNEIIWETEADKDKIVHYWKDESGKKKEAEMPISEDKPSCLISTLSRLLTTLPFEVKKLNIEYFSLDVHVITGRVKKPICSAITIEFNGKKEVLVNNTETVVYEFSTRPSDRLEISTFVWLNEEHQILKIGVPAFELEVSLTSKEEAEKGIAQIRKELSEQRDKENKGEGK